jgi:N-acetylglucosamine-6-phosphate deacetylase
MKIVGLDVVNRAPAEIECAGAAIQSVSDHLGDPDGLPFAAPGFIDLQVNGFAGVDYNNPGAAHAEIGRSIRALYATGVTRFYPTVVTASPDDMAGALANLAAAKAALPEGDAMEGFHVEGPHISPEDGPRGAHPRQWVRPPDAAEFERWQQASGGLVRLVTLSPEWPEAPAYIAALSAQGVVVSIGHTQASAAQIAAAVEAGATMSTHIGNGAHRVMERHPNYIWEQLADDRLAAGVIADGIHLGPAFLKVALRAKTVMRSVLVTDASTPAGAAPGRYRLGEQEIELTPDNRVVLAGTTRLAGSALRMNDGVANLMRIAGLTLVEAVSMATRNPARVGRIRARQRGLTPGDRADIVLFRHDAATQRIDVVETWMGGVRVF